MKKIIYLIMLMTMISIVTASHTLTIPNYLDVNVSEEITIIADSIEGQSATLLLEGVPNPFTRNAENTTFSIFVLSEEEINLNYEILILNGTIEPTRINHTNETQTGTVTIDDNVFYAFNHTETSNETLGDIEGYEVCINIRTFQGTPTIKFFMGTNNGSETLFQFSENHIPTVTLDIECEQLIKTYEKNYTEPFTQYFGFYCIDCDNTNKVRISTNNVAITNKSVTFVNETSLQSIDLTQDWIMYGFEVNNIILENLEGMLMFRVPFYLNFTLFNTRNETLKTSFDYVYLRNPDALSTVSTRYGDLGTSISDALTLKSIRNNNIDTTETFWGAVSGDTASVKLYEAGNYSVTLLSVKTFQPGWGYEFIKPQYTNSKVETLLDAKVIIANEVSSNIKILLSEYEANKSGVIFNAVKWLIFIALVFIFLGVSFMTESPGKAIAGSIVLLTIIFQIFGLTIN